MKYKYFKMEFVLYISSIMNKKKLYKQIKTSVLLILLLLLLLLNGQ